MKSPYVVYADFECILRKMNTCEPDNKRSFTVKTERHEPCGFSYVIARSDGQTFGPYTYKGEDWQKHRNAAECHICNKSLYKDLYLDSMEVFDPDSGKILQPKPQKMLP